MKGMISLAQVMKKHKFLCDESRKLIAIKGHDYNFVQQKHGDTLFNLRVGALLGVVDTPATGVLNRVGDKYMRLISLNKVPPKLKEEQIEDTVEDMINYLVYFTEFKREERWMKGE